MQRGFHLYISCLQGLESMNRAVDGDTVGVVLLDKDQWSGSLEVTFIFLDQSIAIQLKLLIKK
jgi:hypothetical protein